MIPASKAQFAKPLPLATATILTVEPDDQFRSALRLVLEDSGFDVIESANGLDIFSILESRQVDLVLMEYFLPGVDGANLVRNICSEYEFPVVLISQRARVIQKIVGLEMGADDFLSRPIELDELVARMRAILRRARRAPEATPKEHVSAVGRKYLYRFENLVFDAGRRELRHAEGHLLELTSMEIDLLHTFVQNPQRPLSRLSIIEGLGKAGDGAAVRTIDVLVSKLRKKLEYGQRDADIIKTVRGAGYVFTPDIVVGE